MRNLIKSTTSLALHIAGAYIPAPTDRGSGGAMTIIDATCGNGHDTLALAQMIWPEFSSDPGNDLVADVHTNLGTDPASDGTVLYGFDIQPAAVENTCALLRDEGFGPLLEDGHIRILCDSHENIASYTGGAPAQLIMFNLGYLPGGDKSVTTEPGSTLNAVSSSINDLAVGGLVCITMYSGHPAGAKEKAELLAFSEGLDSSVYHVSYVQMLNQHSDPPEILLVSRKK